MSATLAQTTRSYPSVTTRSMPQLSVRRSVLDTVVVLVYEVDTATGHSN